MLARWSAISLGLFALGLMTAASPASAETIAELDALTRATAAPASGMILARRQIAGGDLLGAMATLERILINHPEMRDAQLLRAGLLCRLDDRAGSAVEFDHLRGRGIPDRIWTEAAAPCNAPRGRGQVR